jgi:hypothetical protein
MVWIAFHFIITPIVGLVVSVAAVHTTIKRKSPLSITASIFCALGILWISYISISGSTIILDALGVSFN